MGKLPNSISFDLLFDKVTSNLDLVIYILASKDNVKIKSHIIETLNFDKDISGSAIRKLRQELKKDKDKWLNMEKTLDLENNNSSELINEETAVSDNTDSSKETPAVSSADKDNIEEPPIPGPLSEKNTVSETVSAQEDSEVKEVISITKDNALELHNLNNELIQLKGLCSNLTSENSILTTALNKLCEKQVSSTDELESNKIKNIFAIEIKELSKLININPETIIITVNKEILSKCARFIDTNNLISLEEVLAKNSDLNSAIVQVILLTFIHQNSLI